MNCAREGGTPDLKVRASDLITTVWLQLAELVCGQRKLKKCEALDCGQYLDVTDFKRPGAHRMHHACEERLRKRKLRERQAHARQLFAQGNSPRTIAQLLDTDVVIVKGWIAK